MKKQHHIAITAAALLITLITGWKMLSLWQEQVLWGHLPLLFFISAWATLVLLFWKKYTRHPKGLRWLGLSTISGLFLALGFPPLPFTFLLFIAWVPLLIVSQEISTEQQKARSLNERKSPNLFPYAYHTFVLWNVLVTWWVGNTAFVAGIVAIWINALFMCGPLILFHQTKKVLPNLSGAAFIAYWISFEMLHLHWELSWSWLNLGNAFAEFPIWIQWYEYTGTFGGSLWILLVNVLAYQLWANKNASFSLKNIWQENIKGVILFSGTVLLPIAVSLYLYFNHVEKGRPVEIAVIQPNFEPHYEKFNIPRGEQMKRFERLSREILTDETDYLVFPETSFYAGDKSALNRNEHVRFWKKFLQDYPALKLVTGVSATRILAPDEPLTRNTRKRVRGKQTMYWEAYNAAIQIQADQDSISFYVKSKLVPGAEILPYKEFFFFLEPLVEKLDGSLEGHAIQSNREAFSSSTGKVAPVICYESVFGDYHAGYIRAGAEAIFIVTNDGWWDNTAGHKQHLKYASLRAIETRRSIARSANTGISCFLNQRGDILQPTEYGVEAAISGEILFNNEITFYVKWGDLIGRLAVFLTAIILLNTISKGYLKKLKASSH